MDGEEEEGWVAKGSQARIGQAEMGMWLEAVLREAEVVVAVDSLEVMEWQAEAWELMEAVD